MTELIDAAPTARCAAGDRSVPLFTGGHHALVRKAARKSLAEFNFPRFLAAFDMLDEDVRPFTGSPGWGFE